MPDRRRPPITAGQQRVPRSGIPQGLPEVLRSGAGPRSSSPVVGTGDVLSGRVEIVGPPDDPPQPGWSYGSHRRPRPDPPPAGVVRARCDGILWGYGSASSAAAAW